MVLLPVYSALHLIPTILFKPKALLNDPLRSALKVAFGAVRSSTFIGVFVCIMQGRCVYCPDRSGRVTDAVDHIFFAVKFCLLRNAATSNPPGPIANLLKRWHRSQVFWWLFGATSGLSILVENKHRREELAMYCLPKAMESAWLVFREEALGVSKRRKGAWKADVAVSLRIGRTSLRRLADCHWLSS